MRRGREGSFWTDDSGKVIAINMGADYCAEHEFGIKGIRRRLGIPEDTPSISSGPIERLIQFFKGTPKFGIETRGMTGLQGVRIVHNLGTKGVKVTSGWGKDKKSHQMWGFALVSDWMADRFDLKNLGDYYTPEREQLIGHWCENDFGMLTENKEHVQEMVDAFSRNDIAVWVGASGPFKNGGLIIAIKSRIPQEFLDEMEASDRDRNLLYQTALDTGIHRKLKDAKKEYFALSPRWNPDKPREVMFWLNPYDQNNNNFGWYGVEDLEDWIKGTGKIPKKKEEEV